MAAPTMGPAKVYMPPSRVDTIGVADVDQWKTSGSTLPSTPVLMAPASPANTPAMTKQIRRCFLTEMPVKATRLSLSRIAWKLRPRGE